MKTLLFSAAALVIVVAAYGSAGEPRLVVRDHVMPPMGTPDLRAVLPPGGGYSGVITRPYEVEPARKAPLPTEVVKDRSIRLFGPGVSAKRQVRV
jgi:hypothetical protein